jgi:hypothetical protein
VRTEPRKSKDPNQALPARALANQKNALWWRLGCQLHSLC